MTRNQFIQFMQKSAMYKQAETEDAISYGLLGGAGGYLGGGLTNFLSSPDAAEIAAKMDTMKAIRDKAIRSKSLDTKTAQKYMEKLIANYRSSGNLVEEQQKIVDQLGEVYDALIGRHKAFNHNRLHPDDKIKIDAWLKGKKFGPAPKTMKDTAARLKVIGKDVARARHILSGSTGGRLLKALKGNPLTYALSGAGMLGLGALGAGLD